MSGRGPSDPLGDRPRMAEALASLKEGLRETADPLYDSWKLRQVATDRPVVLDVDGDAARVEGAAGAARSPKGSGANVADKTEAIDIALEGTPPETSAAGSVSEAPASDASPVDGLPTEELLVEFDEEFESPEEPTLARRPSGPSVQADTVRVRVIPYHPFPRWALVVAASLAVFAISLVALRASLPGDSTRVTRPVLASEVPAASPAPPSARPASVGSPLVDRRPGALKATVALAPSAAEPPTKSAAPSAVPQLEALAAPAGAPPKEASSAHTAPTSTLAAPPPAAAPAGKAPTPMPRRRSGAQDFFRDPGF